MSSNFAIIDGDFGLYTQIMCGSIHCDEFNEGKIKKYYSYTHAMEDGWIRTKWIKFCPPGKNFVWVCPSCSKKYKWSNSEIEINLRAMGMEFLTKEECQKAIDVMKARTLWKKTIAELNDGWKPDFENGSNKKCYLFFDHRNNKLKIDYQITWQHYQIDMYAMSEEILEKARKILGDEITRLAWIGE